jgi:hypothetical protein
MIVSILKSYCPYGFVLPRMARHRLPNPSRETANTRSRRALTFMLVKDVFMR